MGTFVAAKIFFDPESQEQQVDQNERISRKQANNQSM
jgi:hypothetical protein